MQFDPKNPPRRKEVCKIEYDGETIDHVVKEVQIGIIDEVLAQVSRIFDFQLDGDIGEQLRTSYADYPKEFTEALSKLTGYDEQDIRGWGLALTAEITLDWINGNYRFVTDGWNKKKGIFGSGKVPKKTAKEKSPKEPKIEVQDSLSKQPEIAFGNS